MDELAVRVETPLQRLLVEQALAFAKELERAARACYEQLALSNARPELRETCGNDLRIVSAASNPKFAKA